MSRIEIFDFTFEDEEAALELENLCEQGKSIRLKFVRPSFGKRSELYENSKIICAKIGGNLIGIAAGAKKNVTLHGNEISAVYGYDLRVHPDYRKHGIGKLLSQEVLKRFGDGVECNYTLIAGQNERALALIAKEFAPKACFHFTYIIIPTYKMKKTADKLEMTDSKLVHNSYLNRNNSLQFVPEFNLEKMLGHVCSVSLDGGAAASIWTNENILAEQVVQMPFHLRAAAHFQNFLRPVFLFPRIPMKNETVKSWFLYDLYADNRNSLSDLLKAVNNLAIHGGRDFLYLFLQNESPLLESIKKLNIAMLSIPYTLLASGKFCPNNSDLIYVDIRDL